MEFKTEMTSYGRQLLKQVEHGDTQTAAVSVIFILIGGFAIPLLTMDTTICLLTALIMQIMVEFLTGRKIN